jgi:hypothetical protein
MKLLDDLFMDKPAGMGMPETGRPQPKEKKTYAPEALGGLVGGPVGAVAAGQIKKIFKPKTDEQIEQEALTELMDPEHEAELVKIKTQAMLSEFAATDPVISTYDTQELVDAYNQVVQLTPRAARQPAVMRGLLRRFLQQQDALEPHEAGQLADVETKLKKLQEPDRLPFAPASPMGGQGR